MLKLLVSHGASFNEVVPYSYQVANVLCTTATPIKQFLLEQQVILNLMESQKQEMLRSACSNHHVELVQYFLDRGASATYEYLGRRTGLSSFEKTSALEFACTQLKKTRREERSKVVKLLLAHGGGEGSRTALALAELCEHSDHGDVQSMRLLLETGHAFVEIDLYDGDTALHRACRSESVTYVKMMLEAGADVHAKDKSGLLPIDLALRLFDFTGLSSRAVASSHSFWHMDLPLEKSSLGTYTLSSSLSTRSCQRRGLKRLGADTTGTDWQQMMQRLDFGRNYMTTHFSIWE